MPPEFQEADHKALSVAARPLAAPAVAQQFADHLAFKVEAERQEAAACGVKPSGGRYRQFILSLTMKVTPADLSSACPRICAERSEPNGETGRCNEPISRNTTARQQGALLTERGALAPKIFGDNASWAIQACRANKGVEGCLTKRRPGSNLGRSCPDWFGTPPRGLSCQ
jgi:hypothetical protein